MLAIGLGLGMAMPVLSTASQNAVEFSDLGVVDLGRHVLPDAGRQHRDRRPRRRAQGRSTRAPRVARSTPLPAGGHRQEPGQPPRRHPRADRAAAALVEAALAHAVAATFLAAVPVGVVAFVLSWFLKELPLRESTTLNAGASAEAERPAPVVVLE